jgi:hypothetical protein
MGWLFTQGQSRADLIKRLTQNEAPRTQDGVTVTYTTVAHAAVGNHLWAVFNVKTESEGKTEEKRFIALFLMQPQKNYGWGYKDMTESMHPYYYTCPKSFLSLAPVACQEWRDKVAEHHAKRSIKLAPGDRVKLNEGCKPGELTIVTVKPLIGVADGGARFRIPRKMIAGKVVSETAKS